MYRLRQHAKRRMRQRGVHPEHVCAALDSGFVREQISGNMIHFDRASRTAVVTDPRTAEIVTVMRLKKKDIKRNLSR